MIQDPFSLAILTITHTIINTRSKIVSEVARRWGGSSCTKTQESWMHHTRPENQSGPFKKSLIYKCRLARGVALGPYTPSSLLRSRELRYLQMRGNGKGLTLVSLVVRRLSRSPPPVLGVLGWRARRLTAIGLQAWLTTSDAKIGSSVQAASFLSHKLRTVKNMSVQTQEGPWWCISSYMEKKTKAILGCKVKLLSISTVQYIACSLTNPSNIMESTSGVERNQKEGQQELPL